MTLDLGLARADARGLDDVIALELLKNALQSIADDMAVTVARTARSIVVKEALDFSTALFDATGRTIAQGTCLPAHLGSMPAAVAAVIREFGETMLPGDIFALNDPYDGGTHLPDIVAVKPVFLAGARVGFAAVLAHQTDIGGRIPGGNASDSTEIYQEGLRIPPVRLCHAGRPSHTLFRLLERNVRVPDKVLGDVRSQIAACNTGEKGLLELVATHGRQGFLRLADALLDYTERYTKAEIGKLRRGTWSFTDWLDNDGIDPGPIKIQAAVTVAADEIVIDLTGTDPQVKGAINLVYTMTCSVCWAAVRSILDLNIPNNDGFFRPIRVIAPEGSIVNPRPPAAVAARALTAFRVVDAVYGALANVVPQKVPAAGSSVPDFGVTVGGYHADGEAFVHLEFLVGSWGASQGRDGADALTGIPVNYSNSPAELIETEAPLMVERYGFVPGTGGAGRYRGGLALERQLRFTAEQGVLQVRSDRRDIAPYGLDGGAPGAKSSVTLLRADGSVERPAGKFLTTLRKGDRYRIQLPSGGGQGDAFARAPAAVLADVAEGKLSAAQAAESYGVIIRDGALDPLATAARRARDG
ncbi:MAG: hydantoinase B/oxoprolinase family protein [Alphaproteobacteria bacterium]|nr:hydantoinase B/oxoprolinase family protein [Alphaproteobacteria bacterium]